MDVKFISIVRHSIVLFRTFNKGLSVPLQHKRGRRDQTDNVVQDCLDK